MIKISGLPFPPTTNHRYIPSRGRLILSPDHRAFKVLLGIFLHRTYMLMDASSLQGKKLKVCIEYSGPDSSWFTKAGDIRKIDVENRHKTLIDGVFKFLDLEDSQIFEINIKKAFGGKELTASMEILCA